MKRERRRGHRLFGSKGRKAASVFLAMILVVGVCLPGMAFGTAETPIAVNMQGATAWDAASNTLTYSYRVGEESVTTGTVVVSSASSFSIAQSGDMWQLTADAGALITLTAKPATGYTIGSIQYGGANQPITQDENGFKCSLVIASDKDQIDVSFMEPAAVHTLSVEGADTAIAGGVFTFTDTTAAPNVLMGSMQVMYGDVTYAGTAKAISLPETNVRLAVSATAGYVPSLSGILEAGGYAPQFQYDGETGRYECSFDVGADAAATVTFAAQPRLTIAAGAGSTVDTTTTAGSFTFKSTAEGAPVLGTMTVSDGGSAYDPASPIYLTNEHVVLAVSGVPSGYDVIVIDDMGNRLQEDPMAPGTFQFDTAVDATVTVSFAKGYTLTLPAAYGLAAWANGNYGIVEWAADDTESAAWYPITTDTVISSTTSIDPLTGAAVTMYNYTFTSDQTVYIKATWPAGNPGEFSGMEGPFPSGTIVNGEAQLLIGSGGLQYDDWYTISWQYADATADDYVSGGKVIIASIAGGTHPEKNFFDNGDGGGIAMVSYGVQVELKFIPDPGYQFTGLYKNGNLMTITAEDVSSTFTMTVDGMFHLSGGFTQIPDIVIDNATFATSANLENGSNAVTSGSAQLIVDDSTPSSGIVVQMKDAAGGDNAEIKTILGMVLNQVISKTAGTIPTTFSSDNAWITQRTEFDDPVTVSVVLDEQFSIPDGSVVCVVRNHVNDDGTNTVTRIGSTYDAATRTLTFTSNLFSEFAIATTSVSAITASAGTGGSITPSGVSWVAVGDAIGYTITPDAGYAIADVVVDGASVGARGTYAFSDVNANHTIMASFKKADMTVMTDDYTGVYDGALHTITAHASVVAGTTLYFSTVPIETAAQADWSTTPPSFLHAGAYTVYVKAENAGYNDAYGKGSVTIGPLSLSMTTIDAIADQAYTGAAIEPDVHIAFGEQVLLRGGDYTLSYADNIAPGLASATVTGVGDFIGTALVSFKISRPAAIGPIRLAGDTALGTMSRIVGQCEFATGGTVVLATLDNFPDAIAASGIAGLADAPVLLTSSARLSDETAAELARLKPATIIICGGTNAISGDVAQAAKEAAKAANLYRCAGATRSSTACAIYAKARDCTGKSFTTTAFVTTGAKFADALAVAPYAYARHCPVFLTENDGSLSPETLSTMVLGGITDFYVLGGTSAVPDSTVLQLTGAGIACSGRLSGKTRYQTCEAIEEFEVDHGMSADGMAIATGENYKDALTGAALCGRCSSVLLLAIDSDRTTIDTFVKNNKGSIGHIYIFGGTAAVSSTLASYLEEALR